MEFLKRMHGGNEKYGSIFHSILSFPCLSIPLRTLDMTNLLKKNKKIISFEKKIQELRYLSIQMLLKE